MNFGKTIMTDVLKTESFNEKHLRSILDNTVDGIVVINSKGIILSYNRACEILFGYKPEEALGKNVKMLMPESYRTHHNDYISNYLTTHEAKIIGIGREVIGERKNGTQFPMWVSISEMIEENEHFFVGILRDITVQKRHEIELKKYNQALERSNLELDDFVYIVSHDLKEPVRGIYSYAQFLEEDYADKIDADGQNKLKSLKRMSLRINELIDRLLYFSRLNKTELSYTCMDLNIVVREVLEMMEHYIEEQNASVTCETSFPNLLCDQARVGEIFSNLITNGIKYNNSPHKEIRIGVTTEHERLPGEKVFYVCDNGIGIPEKHYEAIFKMFKRLHARDAYGGGTGSGLTIVKRIITQHGGTIWVESKPDIGTSFYFTLEKEINDESGKSDE